MIRIKNKDTILDIPDGKFSVTGTVDRLQKPPKVIVEGLIETKTRVPDHFEEMSGGRVTIYDIMINSESLGSEEDIIVYGFTAKRYTVYKIKPRGDS